MLGKRRIQYEAEVSSDSHNYDAWFDYTRLEEDAYRSVRDDLDEKEVVQALERVRDVYERAVANVPPSADEKRYWRRYIFLWLNYALFEEIETHVCSDMLSTSCHDINFFNFSGYHPRATNIPNSGQNRPAQTVHVFETVDLTGSLRDSATRSRSRQENSWRSNWDVSERGIVQGLHSA